jgi:predicted DNA-binding transcriptional regulator AlpA
METTILTTNPKEQNNDEVALNGTTSPLGNKRDVATMLKISVRSVDNYIADGCPVIKLSPRCCRFDLSEVKSWFKTQYGQQSRKSFAQN